MRRLSPEDFDVAAAKTVQAPQILRTEQWSNEASPRRQLQPPLGPHPTTWLLFVDVAKLNDENPSPGAMLGHPEQFDKTGKAGGSGKRRSDISERDFEDLCDHDFAGRKCVAAAYFHMWSLPQANRCGDLASANAIAESSKELHGPPAYCPRSPARESEPGMDLNKGTTFDMSHDSRVSAAERCVVAANSRAPSLARGDESVGARR